MTVAIYPGSFDPPTRAHLDIIQRGAALFDRLIVAVGTNPAKRVLFPVEDRIAMIRDEVSGMDKVAVDRFDGLMIDYARDHAPSVLLRGIRSMSDFEFEYQMALTNRVAGHGVETLFLMPGPRFTFHTTRLIREIAAGGGDVSEFLTESVARRLRERLAEGSSP